MPNDNNTFGLNLAGQAAGSAMGLILGGLANQQQASQQQRLQEIQIKGQKEMTDYNMMKQLQFWKDTNYSAQVEQIEKAGLNPAMLYGMGGAGGATTGNANGNVTGATANNNAMGIAAMAQTNAQLGLLKAQKENIEADTANKKANTGLTGVNTDIAKLEKDLREYALPNAKSMTDQELSKLRTEVQMLWNSRDIQDATKDSQIEQIKQNVTSTMAEIELKRANIGKTDEETKRIAQDISQMAQRLQNETQKVTILQQLADFQTKWGKDAGSILKQMIGNGILGELLKAAL